MSLISEFLKYGTSGTNLDCFRIFYSCSHCVILFPHLTLFKKKKVSGGIHEIVDVQKQAQKNISSPIFKKLADKELTPSSWQ